MINQKEQKNQLPKEIQPAFKELKVIQHNYIQRIAHYEQI